MLLQLLCDMLCKCNVDTWCKALPMSTARQGAVGQLNSGMCSQNALQLCVRSVYFITNDCVGALYTIGMLYEISFRMRHNAGVHTACSLIHLAPKLPQVFLELDFGSSETIT